MIRACALVGLAFASKSAAAQDLAASPAPVAAPFVAAAALQGAPGMSRPELPHEAAAFRDALFLETADLTEADRAAIVAFYAQRGFERYWTAGSDHARVLLSALEGSEAHALPYRRYDAAALALLFDADSQEVSVASAEVAGARTFLRFAGDLAAGIVQPSRVDAEITIAPERPEPAALLAKLNAQPLAQVLAGLEPASPEYRRLMAEKARLDAMAAADVWGPAVAAGATMKAGETGPRVADLRARLGRMGYPAARADAATSGAAGDAAFDAPLSQAVLRFQRDHGLIEDGAVGALTLDALNTGIESRLRQVVVNLERLRWMNRDLGARHILVNIPDYSVTLIDEGTAIWRTRAVVGKASDTRTPEFSDVMSYMVVNPTWHIPDSIALRTYLPQIQDDPGVLARNGMQLLTRSGTEIDPALVDFSQVNAGSFPFRIRQKPSLDNALGRVKFMFPNQFAIYLHDTPARSLFEKDARAFSNGCVRLEQPLEFAYLLLEGQVEDPQASFAGWLEAGTERQVNLERPVPVHLVYRTVTIDEGGIARYRADVYGRDQAVFHALEDEGVTLALASG